MRNRTAIAKINLVWQIDATDLKVRLDNQPGTSHTLVAGVDPFSNKLLFTKVFYSGTRTNKFSSKNIIKILEETLKERTISEELIVHFDRGGQFSSKEFYDSVSNNQYLIGSQTCGGAPTRKAIIERMIRTFKYQLKHLKLDLPTDVKRTRDLQAFCDKRQYKRNTTSRSGKDLGMTRVKFEECLQRLH